MKLDINEVYHNYIIRVVIFALFLFKRQIRQPGVYKQSVLTYVIKRIPWKISLRVDTGQRLPKEAERDILLDELLDGIESDYLSYVIVSFVTPLKHTTLEVCLRDEERYQKFLYS
jgi:hypothetical protein